MSGPGAPADPNAARYDRQLRLWGANGQRALMEARVLVLGASATAAETLKNLVLPGIGHFTIVDGATVTRRDLGNNFFLIEVRVDVDVDVLVGASSCSCRPSSPQPAKPSLTPAVPVRFRST
mmetsp:Transcript_26442/g.82451  ORF Transcript_26442/g.82451 Transcript_26442/m.82451 type:complete len:122 (-) Transcript_26442:2272-2637(-)